MAVEQESELNWQDDYTNDIRNIYRPSKPVFERKSDKWEHFPYAEVYPWWVVPALVLIVLGLAIILVHAQQLLLLV